MSWKIRSETLVGQNHRLSGLRCQDSVACQRDGRRVAIALTDAVGHTDQAAIFGQKIAGKLTEFLLQYYEHIQQAEERSISYNVMVLMERMLAEKCREWNLCKQELASTLMAIAIDSEDGTYCLLHLGDGIMAVQDHDGKIVTLSEPTNGLRLNETVLTTSDHAIKYLKVKKGILREIDQLLLASDGIYKCGCDFENLEEIFRRKEERDILEEKNDDQAYIKCMIN